MQQYTIIQLQNSLVNGDPNSSKYLISTCQNLVKTQNQLRKRRIAIDWLTIEETLKLKQDYDKSRVLHAHVKQSDYIVVKLGNDNIIAKEHQIAEELDGACGFLKYICYLTSNVHVMPYLPLGSIGDYEWSTSNVHILRSLMKQTFLFILSAWENKKFYHGDLHLKNVLIQTTTYDNVHISPFGMNHIVPTHNYTPLIMDFENSTFMNNKKDIPLMTQRFYMDLNKLFLSMSTFIKNIDVTSVSAMLQIISTAAVQMKDVKELLSLNIDRRQIMTQIDALNVM